MKKTNKMVLAGTVLAGLMTMSGCYYGYGSYSSYQSQIPKTTAARDTLEEFDLHNFQESDGSFCLKGLPWGSTQDKVEEYLGASISTTVSFSDGGYYGDLNYSILLADKISVGTMPVFDENNELSCITFYYEDTYTAEALDTFYNDVVAMCTSVFGEPDDVSEGSQTSNKTTFQTKTTFWYHEVSETQMTSLQIGKTDTGSGTDAVVIGINSYNPQELETEEETTAPAE